MLDILFYIVSGLTLIYLITKPIVYSLIMKDKNTIMKTKVIVKLDIDFDLLKKQKQEMLAACDLPNFDGMIGIIDAIQNQAFEQNLGTEEEIFGINNEEVEIEDEPLFINYYKCPYCKTKWEDEYSAMPDDDCPECGTRHISPYKSEKL